MTNNGIVVPGIHAQFARNRKDEDVLSFDGSKTYWTLEELLSLQYALPQVMAAFKEWKERDGEAPLGHGP